MSHDADRPVERAARRRRRREAREAEGAADDGVPLDVVVVAGAQAPGASGLAMPLALAAAGCGAAGHLVDQGRLPLAIAALATGVVALFQHQRTLRIAQVEIEPSKGAVRFLSTRGASASMSTSAITSFDAVRHQRTTDRSSDNRQQSTYFHRLTALKADGGSIDVLEYPDEAAEAARRDSAELNGALERARGVQVAATIDRVAALRENPEVAVEIHEARSGGYRAQPGGGGFSVSWSGRDPPLRFLAFLGVVGGMRLVFAAFSGGAKSNETGIAIAQGFMAFMAAVVVAAFVASFWSRVTLSLEGDVLTLVHRRFTFWVSRQTWPVADIRAVDLSLHGENLVLVVRADDGPSLREVASGDVVNVVGALWAHARNQISLGSLDVSTAMQIDVAFSEAIAERRGEPPGAV